MAESTIQAARSTFTVPGSNADDVEPSPTAECSGSVGDGYESIPRLEERPIVAGDVWNRRSTLLEVFDFLSILIVTTVLLAGLGNSQVLGILLGSHSITLLDVLFAAGMAFAGVGCYRLLGLYRVTMITSRWCLTARELGALVGTVAVLVAVMGVHYFFFPTNYTGQIVIPFAFLALIWFGRSLLKLYFNYQQTTGVRNVVLVGSGPRAQRLAATLKGQAAVNYNMLGFLDLERGPGDLGGLRYLGDIERLPELAAGYAIDEVYLAMPVRSCYDEMERAASLARQSGIPIFMPIDVLDSASKPTVVEQSVGTMVSEPVGQSGGLGVFLKRLLDVTVSLVGLIGVAPFFLAIALAIHADSRGGAIFRQIRVGKGRRRFEILKFRTMREDAEEILKEDAALYQLYVQNDYKVPQEVDPRLTRVGRWLRRTSLDELPQLWNVLRGEMSLVGPRPIVPDELRQYGSVAPVLLRIRPGLTGEWVASGHEAVGYPRRKDVELEYVRRWSLARDFRILWNTVRAVFVRANGRRTVKESRNEA